MTGSENKIIHQLELPVKLDPATIISYLRLGNTNSQTEEMARELADMALAVARPRAIYKVSKVCGIDGDTVNIDGTVFTSRVLRKNLANQDTVYPFIATVGRELDTLPADSKDVMKQYCLDIIKTIVLVTGIDYLSNFLKKEYSLEQVALMNPGEIKAWPITEQRPLFALFSGAEKQIGVELSESGVMKPIKSRSGIVFSNDTGFLSCRLCTQFQCPGRRAPYDSDYEKEYMS